MYIEIEVQSDTSKRENGRVKTLFNGINSLFKLIRHGRDAINRCESIFNVCVSRLHFSSDNECSVQGNIYRRIENVQLFTRKLSHTQSNKWIKWRVFELSTTMTRKSDTIRMNFVNRFFLWIFFISAFKHRIDCVFQRVHTIVMLMQISISCFKLLLYSLLLTVWKRLDTILCRRNSTRHITVTMDILCDIMCIRFLDPSFFFPRSFCLSHSHSRLKRWKYLGIIYIILSLLRLGFLLIYQHKNFRINLGEIKPFRQQKELSRSSFLFASIECQYTAFSFFPHFLLITDMKKRPRKCREWEGKKRKKKKKPMTESMDGERESENVVAFFSLHPKHTTAAATRTEKN